MTPLCLFLPYILSVCAENDVFSTRAVPSLTALGCLWSFSPELFPRPVLTASSSRPVEGNPLTLTCETQLPPQKSHVQLQFRFFREKQTLGSGWQRSTELQIPAVWKEDSGSYSCEAMGSSIEKSSPTLSVQVQSEYVWVLRSPQAWGFKLATGSHKMFPLCVEKGVEWKERPQFSTALRRGKNKWSPAKEGFFPLFFTLMSLDTTLFCLWTLWFPDIFFC